MSGNSSDRSMKGSCVSDVFRHLRHLTLKKITNHKKQFSLTQKKFSHVRIVNQNANYDKNRLSSEGNNDIENDSNVEFRTEANHEGAGSDGRKTA